MRYIFFKLCFTSLLGALGFCLAFVASLQADEAPTATAHDLPWTLLRTVPRSPSHFTEGLVFVDNKLFESTGQLGASRLCAYDASTYAEQQQLRLPDDRFGEGLTFLGNKLYQLTWQNQELRVYGLDLQLQRVLPFDAEGWGLTSDGHQLISSDGSDVIVFRDANTAKPVRSIVVVESDGVHRDNLNELEWVNGKILANVWHRDEVLVIDPRNGHVLGEFDFEVLSQSVTKTMPGRTGEQVLNGLAWNEKKQTLLVTGKDWPVWFEVKLLDQLSASKSR